ESSAAQDAQAGGRLQGLLRPFARCFGPVGSRRGSAPPDRRPSLLRAGGAGASGTEELPPPADPQPEAWTQGLTAKRGSPAAGCAHVPVRPPARAPAPHREAPHAGDDRVSAPAQCRSRARLPARDLA